MIGSVIVLSLVLSALGGMVLLTQQYDQYQQTVNKMAQYQNQQESEQLVAVSPGLSIVNSSISGWGTGCDGSGTSRYNCYNVTLSNLGTIGVQIARIYINSTGLAGSGCSRPNPQPCIINPSSTIASYSFYQANEFLNPGETKHKVYLALPLGVGLPDPNPTFPQNSVVIATSRGSIFSFQWPLQASIFGQSQSAFSSGNMKIAYTGTGFDSKNEPGPVAGGSGGSSGTGNGYCHNEATAPYPAAAGYSEKLTGITGYGDSGVLWFVNPWVTASNSDTKAIVTSSGNLASGTTLYIYVVIVNTGTSAYTADAGSIDLTWYGSNHIDGNFIGVYYNSGFYPPSSPPTIPPGAFYYALFQVTTFTIQNLPWTVQPQFPSVMFWGGASITNGLNSQAEDQSYFSGTILVSGLWLRYEAANGSCA
jgi:hypothetical protein